MSLVGRRTWTICLTSLVTTLLLSLLVLEAKNNQLEQLLGLFVVQTNDFAVRLSS